MKNVIIFALSENNSRKAILKLQENKIVKIKAWFGVDKGHKVITHDYNNLLNVEFLKKNYEICPKEIYNKVYKNLYVFLDMVYRNGDKPIYEYVNIFNMWVNYYYTIFKNNKVEIIIFGDFPHFGIDSIAKDVAEAMNIKTILFMQSLEVNKFWSFSKLDDIGIFESLKNNSLGKIHIKDKFEKEIWYMKKSLIKREKGHFVNLKSIRHLFSVILKYKNNIDDLLAISYLRFSLKFRNIGATKKYSLNLARFFCNKVELNSEYVYFPLHLQPEATTSALGGEFCDQLLAIERLSEIIPDEWKIYVKENPKQSYYMREDEFFKRLSLINKVKLVKKEYDTYDLIRNSQFVATITGTAGWEAISGGKNVLVFGMAWYRKLPGVFEYNDKINIKDILAYKISHDELEIQYNKLLNKAYDGVLECGYEVIVKDYSDEKNNEYLYDAFRNILEKY